jgi:hypothetical protein
MGMSFHNTIGEQGTLLQESERKARTQDERILRFFSKYPDVFFGPSDIQAHFPEMLLTSVRRSITNLTKNGKLEKTTRQKIGAYNKKEYLWKLT